MSRSTQTNDDSVQSEVTGSPRQVLQLAPRPLPPRIQFGYSRVRPSSSQTSLSRLHLLGAPRWHQRRGEPHQPPSPSDATEHLPTPTVAPNQAPSTSSGVARSTLPDPFPAGSSDRILTEPSLSAIERPPSPLVRSGLQQLGTPSMGGDGAAAHGEGAAAAPDQAPSSGGERAGDSARSAADVIPSRSVVPCAVSENVVDPTPSTSQSHPSPGNQVSENVVDPTPSTSQSHPSPSTLSMVAEAGDAAHNNAEGGVTDMLFQGTNVPYYLEGLSAEDRVRLYRGAKAALIALFGIICMVELLSAIQRKGTPCDELNPILPQQLENYVWLIGGCGLFATVMECYYEYYLGDLKIFSTVLTVALFLGMCVMSFVTMPVGFKKAFPYVTTGVAIPSFIARLDDLGKWGVQSYQRNRAGNDVNV